MDKGFEFIAGIDPSISHIGIVLINNKGKLAVHHTCRITEMHSIIIHLPPPSVVVIENPSRHRRAKVVYSAMKAIIAEVSEHWEDAKIITVAPQTWRKAILGNGRASKQAAIAYAESVCGVRLPHDEAEAFCLAQYGLNLQRLE